MSGMIKPIEAKSIHQIQSGQVIVDLCSVVKELVENAVDADATTIEIRFKNHGLDAIEVQDNGTGIAEANYESLALKHYTSKIATYDDLSRLQTFGFRGEALSSLCALSTLAVTTAQAHEAPRGKRLEFETSGKLRSTTFVAAQKGTTVIVENLFAKLPVRQKELSKNIKREYGKVVGLLQSYACISTNVKYTVKNAMPRGRSAVVFSTKGISTTRENIANVYGTKMLAQLIELDLKLDFQPALTKMGRSDTDAAKVHVSGHISKPVFGEGRQATDRQLFYVNGRPCGLPQIQKAINEVYASFNVTQKPFILADFRMDTNAYDVNVSPDKRTILLHYASALTDKLKETLMEKFDAIDQTVPQSQIQNAKLPVFRQISISGHSSISESETTSKVASSAVGRIDEAGDGEPGADSSAMYSILGNGTPQNLMEAHFGNIASSREEAPAQKKTSDPTKVQKTIERQAEKIVKVIEKQKKTQAEVDEHDDVRDTPWEIPRETSSPEPANVHIRDFNARMREQQHVTEEQASSEQAVAKQQRLDEVGVIPNAFVRMRPRKLSPEMATITVGDKDITKTIGTPKSDSRLQSTKNGQQIFQFSRSLRKFGLDANEDGDSAPRLSSQQERMSDEGVFSDTAEDNIRVAVQRRSSSTPNNADVRTEDGGEDISTQDRESLSHIIHSQPDEMRERAEEERRVAQLIRAAEESNAATSKELQKRTTAALNGASSKHATTDQIAVLNCSRTGLLDESASWYAAKSARNTTRQSQLQAQESFDGDEEERLSLTISKTDFAKMHIAGQFNKGFIIAMREKNKLDRVRQRDEVFIVDQHASDEKFNFERLQAETTIGNQRLVHPVLLDLTAVEEEIVFENGDALRQNGFLIEADTSGHRPVGQRCKLVSLPLSKEVTFSDRDLEELVALLAESHISKGSAYVPRPSKVRKMFAMRACRSSIMIGKTLSMKEMRRVLDHMGRIDKPWNCPHGRPTMRHLISLENLDDRLWSEGDGLVEEDEAVLNASKADVWRQYAT